MNRGEQQPDKTPQQEQALQTLYHIIENPAMQGYQMIDFSELLGEYDSFEDGSNGVHFLYAIAGYKPAAFSGLQTKNELYGLSQVKYINRLVTHLHDRGVFDIALYESFVKIGQSVQAEVYGLSSGDVAIQTRGVYNLPSKLPVGVLTFFSTEDPELDEDIAVEKLRFYFPYGLNASMIVREFMVAQGFSYSFN